MEPPISYRLYVSVVKCVDINECENAELKSEGVEGPCQSNAECVNEFGYYMCHCISGPFISILVSHLNRFQKYSGVPLYTCFDQKRKGYTNVAEECVDIDECLLFPCGNEEVVEYAGEYRSIIQCINTLGSYECACSLIGLTYNADTRTCINNIDDYCRQGIL